MFFASRSFMARALRFIEPPRFTGGLENKVAPPDGLNPFAKPSRYTPAPGYAPGGKRRRQWR